MLVLGINLAGFTQLDELFEVLDITWQLSKALITSL